MFKSLPSNLNVITMEEAVLRFWKHRSIFNKASARNEGGPEFVFYEGPPSVNAPPAVHHVLARAYKDIFPRYKTMRGYHVLRKSGWDTHGLPVEIAVEKRLGFTNKTQIEAYGIDRFNALCRAFTSENIQAWERLTDRIGFWVDFENAYITCSNDYIESVWWVLKSFWEKGLLYQGFKVVPYCPRCGTPLSDHEVALGYHQAIDPSIYVRFPLVDDPGTSLLVWTTTPWTLPANVAVAAHPEVDYVIVERQLPEGGVERLILAQDLVGQVFEGETVQVFETFKGRKLKGLRYHPLFTFILPEKPGYYVLLEDFVNTEEGTGLVHLAPAYGAEDLQAALESDLPVIQTVSEAGAFLPEIRPWSGKFVKDADPLIILDLYQRGLLYKSGTYEHTYPFCWRCDTPLLYTARNTWFLRTTEFKEKMVSLNQEINWHPEHIKDGRFGNWLENNVDWALGRERYWGTPLPIWECPACHHQQAFGSLAELAEASGGELSGLDLHRPFVDEVIIPCPECKEHMRRVPELVDVWFDSGAMPVAQWHYPFENEEAFKRHYPADFIAEGVDQTRGWFYSLHAVSTMLFERASFQNALALGLILDEEGQKMSKSLGNIVDPWDVINQHGADAFRWYLYTASPAGQERRFSADLVGEVVRNFTLTLWNVYSFFLTYAELDDWQPGNLENEKALTDLDRWLLSELQVLVEAVTNSLENYDAPGATRPVEAFVNQLSRWYLRRSRRRFWKGGTDADKEAAYSTLYETLVTLSKLLAPTMPFLAEELYRNLVYSAGPLAPESVHLAHWPESQEWKIDETLNREMQLVMKLASLGHAARDQAGIKVRQPLSEAAFAVGSAEEIGMLERYAGLLAEELNVKNVRALEKQEHVLSYRLKPLPRQLGSKYRADFPTVREAILALNAGSAAQALLEGNPILIKLHGEVVEILPEEVEVRLEAPPGLATASGGPYLAALKTELSPELVQEGLAREFVRRVQDLRKQAGFEITDRIRLFVSATAGLTAAVLLFKDYIMGETLAVDLVTAEPPEGNHGAVVHFDGEQAHIGIVKAIR